MWIIIISSISVVVVCIIIGILLFSSKNNATTIKPIIMPTTMSPTTITMSPTTMGPTTTTSVYSLYQFKSHTFTTCGAIGRLGPTYSKLRNNYSDVSWTQNSEFLYMTKQGIQLWKVPISGSYKIEAIGAKGGGKLGGFGVLVVGTFNLKHNDVLSIVVGQQGVTGTIILVGPGIQVTNNGGGGGGASYIVNGSTLLIAAGGGGGGGNDERGSDASTSNSGISTINDGGGKNGNGGLNGKINEPAAGGAGWISNGENVNNEILGGKNFDAGAEGGSGTIKSSVYTGGDGGFGGGGGGYNSGFHRGGGGGGYSGGQGGSGYSGGGGGGGSYCIQSNFNLAEVSNNNDGSVKITLL